MIKRTQDEIIQNWHQEYNHPLVSVRCTAYNHEKYIAQALDSFLMQETNFPFEIVVHDDASTDKTADIIREYESKYPKIIKPIYEAENLYSKKDGSLRRTMDNACRGKYIAYCEGDDFWCDSHKLQMQYEALEAHPECSLCTHIVQTVSEKGNILERQHPSKNLFKDNVIEQNDFAQALIADHSYPFQTSSFFLRKALLLENGSFFEQPGNGDEKILRICLNAGKVFFIQTVMSCYRQQSIGSWSSRVLQNKKNWLESLSKTLILEGKFDEFSNYKFHKFVEISKKKLNILIFIQKKQFNQLFTPEYKDITKSMFPTKVLFLYFIYAKIPNFLLNKLFEIRNKLKR